MTSKFILEPRHWYGWTMWPGYGDTPYHSPIWVEAIEPLGQRRLDLTFCNLGYAAGVQHMTQPLRTFKRGPNYLIAEIIDSDRSVAIEPLTRNWFATRLPKIEAEIEAIAKASRDLEPAIATWLARHAPLYIKDQD